MNDAPECWGKYRAGDASCRECDYPESCRYCAETESRMNRPLGGQDFDSVAEWAPDLADDRRPLPPQAKQQETSFG